MRNNGTDDTMNKNQIAQNVREFVTSNFIFEEAVQLKADQSLLETGIVDSTGILELVNYLEETYSISIDDEELVPDNLDSVNKIAAYVGNKLAAS